MFKITTEKETKKQLTFKDVTENQFFVNFDGFLCQKTNYDTYAMIASSSGKPVSHVIYDVAYDQKIKKIFPKVIKIEF
jgi:hypothetical protein